MILEATDLKVRYRNGALGILDVSLQVDSGQVVAIFGPNGAGKTTTVRAISGFLRAEGARVIGGKVMLFGNDTTNAEPSRTTAMGLAFVPERGKVFPSMTVRENLQALGKRPARARRKQIQEHIEELFPVIGRRQHELAGRLSGGEQQMLAVARSLLCEAPLLTIDEVPLGLHYSVQGPLFEVLRRRAADGTGLILVGESTHRLLDIADHCYLIGGGRVRAEGEPSVFRDSAMLPARFIET